MNGFLADIRHAIRVYFNTPLISAIAIVALAVSMAFVSAFLSLWNDLAFKPHDGFERSGRLVTVGLASESGIGGIVEPLIADFHASTFTLDGIAGIDTFYSPIVEIAGERIPMRAELVTAGYFAALRPRLQTGSGLSESDHRLDAELAVVISDDLWRRYFDRRSEIVGSQIELFFSQLVSYPGCPDCNTPEVVYEYIARSFRVVGVMSKDMRGTFDREEPTAFWVAHERVAPDLASETQFHSIRGVGRIADGATVQSVAAELDVRYPEERVRELGLLANPFLTNNRLAVMEGVMTSPGMLRDGKRQVGLFLAGTLLLAVVAACNASLFLLSRAPGRRRELGIRLSMGATTQRLARQLASEAMLLVVTAAAMGILISLWLAVMLRDLVVFQDVQWRDISPLDWRVLGMLVGVTVLLGGVVSLAPMLGFKRQGIAESARSVSARAGWAQKWAGTVQLCVAAIVSAVAVAFVWQLVIFSTADRGFTTEDISVVRISSATLGREQGLSRDERNAIREHRREVIGNLPGVESVALASLVPGEEFRVLPARADAFPNMEIPGDGFSLGRVEIDEVFPQIFNLEIVRGRPFDGSDSNPVLVNETLAQALWGRTDVVGEQFMRSDVVVGVLRDLQFGHPSNAVPATYFAPVGLVYDVIVRSDYSPGELHALLQQTIDSGDLEMEIEAVEGLEAIWNAQFSADRARIRMSAVAAVLVVLLAAFGFYGTQRYLVVAGRREYAIRAAIGGGPQALGVMVLARGFIMSLPGVLFGSLLAFIAVAWLRDGFVTATVSSLGVAAVVTLALLLLVLMASFGPSMQVRQMQPARLLRED